MTVELLVLQHIACEPPAIYEDVLIERGIGVHRVELDEGETPPDWRGYRGIVVMGGPMSANDEAVLPWLAPEKRLIADAARGGVPVWGVCLGAQLLAAALGGRVYVGEAPEVGVCEVMLTDQARTDPVFHDLPDRISVFQWHSDTFDLPPGARWLATSSRYRHQAFAWGSSYGLQFHTEVTPQLAAQWAAVPEYAHAIEAVRGPGAVAQVLAELQATAATGEQLARTLFDRWLSDVVRASTRAA